MIKVTRRTLATAAAVLALGAGSAAWAATSASAAPAGRAVPSAVIPRCTASELAVWVNANSADGTAGTTFYHLDFTNLSGKTCHLYSYPGVSAVNREGKQLGQAAQRGGGVPATYVNILPGHTVHSVLGYVDVQVTKQCKPAGGTFLKVFAPDDKTARLAFFPMPLCTTATADLTIWRVQSGA